MSKKQTPESALLSLCMEYLAANRVMAFRMNVGAVTSGTRFFRFGVPGMADILAFPKIERKCGSDGYYLEPIMWLELKTPKGVQSDLQKSFQAQVERKGHRYILIRSLEDLKECLL